MKITIDYENKVIVVNEVKYSFAIFECLAPLGFDKDSVFIIDNDRCDGHIALSKIGRRTVSGIELTSLGRKK